MKKAAFLFITLFIINFLFAQSTIPKPTKQQMTWHNTEFYLFAHFGPNTFTDKEWGHGDEPEDIFNPTELDCRQWCKIAKKAGAAGIIITAKHHDGFCLWPSKYSTHTVRESNWKNGKGDVLKELSIACKEFGLNFGVYISPWDRNHPDYGTEKYNDVFVNMMEEIFTNYGPVYELWWDGANGEGPNGKKQEYDWSRFRETVRRLSPNTVVFSDVGPDIRWVGNESGFVGTTNWNMLNVEGFTAGSGAPSTAVLNTGNEDGTHWIPGECDVSIRPGWFYHTEEDNKVKTPEELMLLYLKSIGRGATLLLNIPPDRRGKFHTNDSASLMGFKKLRDKNFKRAIKTDLQKKSSAKPLSLWFKTPKKINCVILREDLLNGQAVKQFTLSIKQRGKATPFVIEGTTIGRKRILSFPTVNAASVTLTVTDAKRQTWLYPIEARLIQESLIEK